MPSPPSDDGPTPVADPLTRRRHLGLLAGGAASALAGCSFLGQSNGRVDDWQYEEGQLQDDDGLGGVLTGLFGSASMGAQASGSPSMGFAAGGAKDIAAFRRNLDEGYLPQPDSLAVEGLYYNYRFDTGGDGSCSDLFCPTYSTAVTSDPLSGETERYLTVGLNSGMAASSFERKQLNLVVVLDVSGSMDSSFSEYYYDRFGNRQTPKGDTSTAKIEVARNALVTLTEQLRPDDRLGVVLYNDEAAVAKPLNRVEDTDMEAIRSHIQSDVTAGGGTNLDAGLDHAVGLFDEYADADPTTWENRMMVLTDAMPNVGETDDEDLRDRLGTQAERGVHATFVGVGVDFNAALVDELTSIRGANYYGVHSSDEFERRMGEEFEYAVTPLVYDLDVELDASGYEIDRVYGSTAAEEATGQLMHVNTLFPSPTEDGKTRGGVVLVKVRRAGAGDGSEPVPTGDLTLEASWETRTGEERSRTTDVSFPSTEPEFFATSSVRKAVLLARYADLLRNWLVYERDAAAAPTDDGIAVSPRKLGEWEQQSIELTVSPRYRDRISTFREHFASEGDAIGDDALDQELDTMDTILDAETARTETATPTATTTPTQST